MAYQFKRKKGAASELIAATDAAKNFGGLVDRVREEGATYVIERHGRAVAQIGPVQSAEPRTLRNFVEMMRAMPKLDEETLRYIEEGVAASNRPEVPQNPWER
jgi:antitoxin (DNA-binding transcriptional repressor) of toxin-antitoxin stability system